MCAKPPQRSVSQSWLRRWISSVEGLSGVVLFSSGSLVMEPWIVQDNDPSDVRLQIADKPQDSQLVFQIPRSSRLGMAKSRVGEMLDPRKQQKAPSVEGAFRFS